MTKQKICLAAVLLISFTNSLVYATPSNSISFNYTQTDLAITVDTLTIVDQVRNRKVPVAFYSEKKEKKERRQKLIIFSHGYGQNRGGDYLAYSYLTNNLASKGYFVVSIQHELSTDSLIPPGVPQIVRRPFWERGADNIWFIIESLKTTHPYLDFKHIVLIGHSNGGDMTALFPQKYTNLVDKIITLDNRRMALPRTIRNPSVYSLRSCDQPADEGVLPTILEQRTLKSTIVRLPNTTHNEMDDSANPVQRKEINYWILRFLKD